jgi:phenylpyruvate tautomerase PptA (4-oxalocrotonate tautomerase family)
MPLVRISLLEGRPEPYRRAIADGVHRALMETMNVSERDRFQIIEEHQNSGFIYSPEYEGTLRTDALVVIQITLNRGRTVAMKRAFFDRVVTLLQVAPGLRREDVFIGLVEVDPDNWFVL